MKKLEIPRTATFAWSPSITDPALVTGTRAGAVDADFSNETKLELWDLSSSAQAADPQPTASITTESRLYDLAWSPRGTIAGAGETGSLFLWDASKLANSAEDALISSKSKHTGPIKSLQFNPHHSELLATSGAKGELYITDLNNPDNPFRLGTAAARADDFDALDWNKQVAHIMATAGSGGFVTVWDVKAKKESLTLNNYSRKPASAVAWNPDLPTKLATAVPSDQDPLILMWDLRNSSAPERILKGHDQGVLSLSWCRQDSSLLLSCGKDNRNICWDPQVGEAIGEFPIVTNWTFQTRWSPSHPNMLATASFDGKIAIQTIQNTNSQADQGAAAAAQPADGADFFAKAQTQPSGSTFSLSKAPKWLKRPVGVSFAFGGKLVSFAPSEENKRSTIKISTYGSDPGLEKSITEFAEALKADDMSAMFDKKIEAAPTEESKNDWRIIQTLISDNPRQGLLSHLGFSDPPSESKGTTTADESTEDGGLKPDSQTNGVDEQKATNRLSSFFDNSGDSQGFLADLAATKGAKTNSPFQIFTGSESEADKNITRALMLGRFEEALDVCLKENRMSDAFMIAICGGQACIDKAQTAYFAQQSDGPNYLRLLAAVVGKNLWDVVHNADLKNWAEVMASLCTFADETELPDLCEALGDRLEELADSHRDASFCYLAGSKLEKVVPIWIEEMKDAEKSRAAAAEDESAFSIHVQALQGFIEKVSIFRKATQYRDSDGQDKTSGWKLEPLYAKYAEYADVISAYGYLDLAAQYLALLPADYPAADVARNRVTKAQKKVPVAPAARAPAQQQQQAVPASGAGVYGAPGLQQPYQGGAPTYAPASNFIGGAGGGYQPSAASPVGPSYAPPNAFASSAYQPLAQNLSSPPPVGGIAPPSGPPTGPPRAGASGANGNNWNDLPENFQRQPPSRRGTPSAVNPPVNNPYINPAPQIPSAPPPPGAPRQAASPLPPPPKSGALPPRTSSPLVDRSVETPQRPPSSAASAYAPAASQGPPQQNYAAPPPMPARGGSPYNAPPSGPPPSSRYTPVQSSQTPQAAPPTPGSRPPIAPNPYAPQQSSQPQYGGPPPPQQQSQPPPSQAPPPPSSRGPPPPGPPPAGGPPSRTAPPPSQPAPPPASTKHPPGDRSHIPAESVPIYQGLDTEMQRIKGVAPANFKAQVDDTDKRLNILYDLLNNDEIKAEHIVLLKELVAAFTARNFDQAVALHTELLKQVESQGPWLVGVKRLISMSRATPV